MTDEELNNLISQTDIVNLVSKYVTLTKKGKNYTGLCPFHNEKTPSFFVSPEKGLATCFGCHKGGNALTFIKEIENVDTKRAIDILCEINGIKNDSYKPTKEDTNKKYYEILNKAKDFYKFYLENDVSSKDAKDYLYNRGLNDEIISEFEIGLSPDNKDTLYQVLTKSGYLELDSYDMGLINNNNQGYYDIFRDRIMFPIKDDQGRTLGFSGRKYRGPDSNDKYINTTDTKIFIKGNNLFNLNLAKKEINKKNRIILHEGQMDVIASYKAGLREAVSSLGTSLTQNQINLISKYTKNVIICYDADKAGIKSSLRAINLFKKNNFNIHLVLLKDNLDPDEMVKKYGADEYLKYFEENIIDDVEYQYRIIIKNIDIDDKEKLNNGLNEAYKLLSSLNSNILEEKYIGLLSRDLNISIDSIKADFDKYKSTYTPGYFEDLFEDRPKKIENKKRFRSLAELRLFIHAKKSKLQALKIDSEINNYLNALSIENQNLWMTLINDYYCKFDEFDEAYFVKLLSKEDMEQYLFINEKLANDIQNYDINDLEKCINKIKVLAIDDEIQMKKNLLRKTQDENKKKELMNDIFLLKKRRGK